MSRSVQSAARAALLAGLLLLGGCGMGGWEDVLDTPGRGGEIRGEIDRIDSRDREIEVSSGWGRSTRVQYNSRTEVVYRDRRYRVTDLERGDRVTMRVQRDRSGDLYTNRIYVEGSGRDRRDDRYPGDRDDGPRVGRVERFDGRVASVDSRRGRFQLRDNRWGAFTVTLPYDPSSSTRERFRRLRRGDNVRIEAEVVGQRRLELRRFVR